MMTAMTAILMIVPECSQHCYLLSIAGRPVVLHVGLWTILDQTWFIAMIRPPWLLVL